MKPSIVVTALLGCFLLSIGARAQMGKVGFRTPGSDSVKVVDILNGDTYRNQTVNDSVSITTLVGHVAIKQEKTIIYCDSLTMLPHDNIIDCFGHVHVNDNDSVHIRSDFMRYQVDSQTVLFHQNVNLTDGKGVLTTSVLITNLNTKIGAYDQGGKLVNKETVLTSYQGTYYEQTRDIHF